MHRPLRLSTVQPTTLTSAAAYEDAVTQTQTHLRPSSALSVPAVSAVTR
jgi:hypothetical protein